MALRRPIAWTALLAVAAAVAGAALLRLESGAPVSRRPVAPAEIGHSDRLCFATIVSAPEALMPWPYRLAPFDGMDAPSASPHLVLEDGRPAGPPHSQHLDIAERGGGAFSFWGGAVYFSSSDQSDPRTNGRTYELELVAELHPAVRLAARALVTMSALLLALLAVRSLDVALTSIHRRRRAWSPIAALVGASMVAAAVGSLAWAGHHRPVVVPIPPHAMTQGDGRAVTVSLQPLIAEAAAAMWPGLRPGPSNRAEAPAASKLRVRCDGQPLSRRDTQFANIAQHGAGRYVAWGDVLALSSPDGASPRTDGRRYELEVDARAASWLVVAAAFTSLIGAGLLVASAPAKAWRRALPAAASIGAAIVLGAILLRPESAWIAGVLPVVCVVLAGGLGAAWAVSRLSRGPGMLAAFRRLHRVGCVAVHRLAGWRGLLPVTMLVAASLLHAWSPADRPPWQMGTLRGLSLFEGRAQATDALGYLASSEWVRWLGSAGAFGSRRPVYSSWLSATSALTGLDLQAIVALHALFAALALWLAMSAMARHVGPALALAAGGICLGALQQFVGVTMNEALGLPLGLLAVSMLLPALHRRSASLIAAGSATLALGLIVRPGAMFVLALLPVAAAWSSLRREAPPDAASASAGGVGPLRRPWRRGIAAASCAAMGIAAAVALNSIVAGRIGDSGAATNSNFGYVLYGLSIGKDWGAGVEWLREHAPELGEREQAARLVEEALRNIRHDPATFLGSLAWAARDFVLTGIPQISTYYADRGLIPMGQGSNGALVVVFVWGALGPLALVIRRRGHGAVAPLLMLALVGVFLSVPLIWRDGHWRALAATLPLQAMVAAFFLAPPRAPAGTARGGRQPRLAVAATSLVAVAALAVAFGLAGRDAAGLSRAVAASGPAIYTDPSRLLCVEITPNPSFRWLGPASLDLAATRQAIADWGVEESVESLLGRVDPTRTCLLAQAFGIDEGAGMVAVLLLVPPELVEQVRQREGRLAALEIEWCGETLYLGRLGILRGIRT